MGDYSQCATTGVARLLAQTGLDTRERQGWALFDVGDNAFATVINLILQTYFVTVAGATLPDGDALIYWSFTVALSYGLFAVMSPVLGAIADHLERSRLFLASFTAVGVVASGSLFFTGEGDWLAVAGLFLIANVGFSGARLFYNSLLPGIASGAAAHRVSTAGYASGYLGGGVLLALGTVVLATPGSFGISGRAEASRILLFASACWWAAFAVPLFVYVPEPPRDGTLRERVGRQPVRAGFARLAETFREVRTYRVTFLFLLAFFCYSSGITAIINLAAAYASDIGLGQTATIGALLVVQFVGVPCAVLFGQLAGRYTTKRMLIVGLTVYTLVSLAATGIRTIEHFFALAVAVGAVQGGTQALSRSLYSSLIPAHRSAEFFSFFAVVSAVSSIMAPLLFGIVGLTSGSNRLAIGSLSVFFFLGALLIARLNVRRGRTIARQHSSADTPPETS